MNQKHGDALLLNTPVFSDHRGYFTENWNDTWQAELGIKFRVKQTNACWTEKANTVRGMHAQYGKGAMAKLVRCVKGSIIDVVVDARKKSPTFGQWTAFQLDGPEHSVFVPRGYYHGYVTLTDDVIVLYNQDNVHVPGLECGLSYGSNMDFWRSLNLVPETFIRSERDVLQPEWGAARKFSS